MAAGTPLTRLTLGAASVADDLGYVALSDLARAPGDIAADCRVIGGHMVTVLAARWRLGHELYRETGDVDLGIPPIVARDHHVVGRLKDLDYTQVAGNRFARGLSDIPVQNSPWRCLSAVPTWLCWPPAASLCACRARWSGGSRPSSCRTCGFPPTRHDWPGGVS